MPISTEAAAWGLRLLIGIEPDDADCEFHRMGYSSLDDMRTAFLQTSQARELFANANPPPHRPPQSYSLPLFLLRPPAYDDVPYLFSPPSLTGAVCQLCTSEQMEGIAYTSLCKRLGMDALAKHRKIWEFTFVLAALQQRGKLAPGFKGLGFGTGQEPLPSAFAAAGVQVTATDAPAELTSSEQWSQSAQWTNEVEDLWKSSLVDRAAFEKLVRYRPVDMNAIPTDLWDFDFCWSACCLEHLGSIRNGLDFIRNSLDTLRSGGVAVHTTEFNLRSDDQTLETDSLCLFRKQDIELVLHELIADGHKVEPLNLWPGASPVDEHIDLPPFSSPHLKLQLTGEVTTSVGLIITKR